MTCEPSIQISAIFSFASGSLHTDTILATKMTAYRLRKTDKNTEYFMYCEKNGSAVKKA